MIEINLIEKKGKFKAPTILGIDLSKLNYKMLVVAIILNYVPENYLNDYYVEEQQKTRQEISTLNKRLRKLKKEVRGDRNVKQKLEAFNNQVEKLKQRSNQVSQIVSERTNPRDLLEKIAKSVPEDLWITELSIDDNSEIKIKGQAMTYRSIGNFIVAANESPFFGRTLTLKDSKTKEDTQGRKGDRVEQFEIAGKVVQFYSKTL